MAAKQAMKENLQCTSKYGHLRISQDICHVRMTDIEGFLTKYGHSDNLLNNNNIYILNCSKTSKSCILVSNPACKWKLPALSSGNGCRVGREFAQTHVEEIEPGTHTTKTETPFAWG